ncbi:MAG: hypothetical protein CFE21_17270 [Bacteroidetes bacterium B1(2017)]|nr:MAG: hypothetical protein CFE21_17270 [Bacteroidetes bacterium B1(2017)]
MTVVYAFYTIEFPKTDSLNTLNNRYMKYPKMMAQVAILFMSLQLTFAQQTFVRKTKQVTTFNSSPQLSRWLFPNASGLNQVLFNPSTSAVNNTNGRPTIPITNMAGFNSYSDENGRILFYVISSKDGVKIFDKNNLEIALPFNSGLDVYSGKQIGIVPFLKNCEGRVFHIIVGGRIIVLNFNSMDNSTNCSLLMDNGAPFSWAGVNIQSSASSTWMNEFPMAISKPSEMGIYNLYTLSANNPGITLRTLNKYVINGVTSTLNSSLTQQTNISSFQLGTNQVNTNFNNYTSEMEVSPNGNYLSLADNNFIFIYPIGSNGNIGTLYKYFDYNNSQTALQTTHKIGGLEFSTDGKLVFSIFGGDVAMAQPSNFIGKIDLATPISSTNPSYISGLNPEIGRSVIELGSDGLMYVSDGNYLYTFTSSASSITQSFAISNPRNFQPFTFTNTNGINYSVHTLPQQMDGYYYPKLPSVNYYANKVTFDFGATTVTTLTAGTAITPLPWTESTELITLTQGLEVKSGTVILRDFNFELPRFTDILVQPGAKLVIINTTLQGYCNQMWNGVKVLGNGSFEMFAKDKNLPTIIAPPQPDPLKGSKIFDALVGISTTNLSSNLYIGWYSYFDANEYHLKITNTPASVISNAYPTSYPLSGINIMGSTFSHNLPLLDPTKGISYAGLVNGIHSIVLNNPYKPAQTNANILKLFNCSFRGGYNGIDATNANFEVLNSNFYNVHNAAIFDKIDCFYSYPIIGARYSSCAITNTSFKNCNQGIVVYGKTNSKYYGGVNATIQKCVFDNIWQESIIYKDNRKSTLLIGDEINAFNKNTFQNFSHTRAIIHCENNISYTSVTNGTSIIIANNAFASGPTATGIKVFENTLPAQENQPSYSKLLISNNAISNIQTGIALSNVGAFSMVKFNSIQSNSQINYYLNWQNTKLYNFMNFYNLSRPQCDIIENTISNSLAENVLNTAISIDQCYGPHIAHNTIASSNKVNSFSRGIAVKNSNQTLVTLNLCSNGIGIYGYALNLGSELSCNTLDNCRWGIKLENHVLRNVGETHGIPGDRSYHNQFTNVQTKGADILLYRTNKLFPAAASFNKWVFKPASPVFDPKVRIINVIGTPTDNQIRPSIALNNLNLIDATPRAIPPCEVFDSTGSVIETDSASTDALLEFQKLYLKQLHARAYGLPNIPNTFLVKYFTLSEMLTNGEYETANQSLQELNPQSNFENYLKTYLGIYIACKYPLERGLMQHELDQLATIASMEVNQAGPAKYFCKAWVESEMGGLLDEVSPEIDLVEGQYGISGCNETPSTIDSIALVDINTNTLYPIVALYDENMFSVEPVHFKFLPEGGRYDFVAYTGTQVIPLGFARSKEEIIQSELQDLYFPCPENQLKRGLINLTLLPNPTQDELTLLGDVNGLYSLKVVNLVGETLIEIPTLGNKQKFSIGHLPTGIYLIRLSNLQTKEQKTLKIQKN